MGFSLKFTFGFILFLWALRAVGLGEISGKVGFKIKFFEGCLVYTAFGCMGISLDKSSWVLRSLKLNTG